MLERYKTIYQGNVGEIIEKTSRFIATVRLVENEEEALAFIGHSVFLFINQSANIQIFL